MISNFGLFTFKAANKGRSVLSNCLCSAHAVPWIVRMIFALHVDHAPDIMSWALRPQCFGLSGLVLNKAAQIKNITRKTETTARDFVR